ncbi:SNF1-related kinase complex anchoring protein SIP1 isoform X1 [Solanum lycopersicum]|uniref:Sip1 n=1 Tax=Solanum lycopersicum TaxID=4081 RepID=G4XQK5_SOLLC|nr:SNF1-related kinase complex anchoring protein SIP1 isoform X1 [Solanum lycopersicum]AEP68530.1 Sip1 [Solanum lycopersicum]
MGNVNGREENEGNIPSGVEGVDGIDSGGVQDIMAVHQVDGEFMGQSPPSSPRASRSPLMFRPEMPVVPLQRPDEGHGPSISWSQTTSGYEEPCDEQGVPTLISWTLDGKEVAVEGSWDNWKSRMPLQKSGKDFTILKVLPSGVYQYRFIVDGQWRCSPDLPCVQDEAGNTYNLLDMKDYVPEDIESISGFEPPQSPDSSYNNLHLVSEDYAKEPPVVPPHLQMTLLNVSPSHMEIPPPLSRPQHVVLNHLYMQKDRSTPSVVALGSTNRFLSKYVTVVLYKSIQS